MPTSASEDSIKKSIRRFSDSLLQQAATIGKGALFGTLAAILLPTALTFYSIFSVKLTAPWYGVIREGPNSTSWLRGFVAPVHFWILIAVSSAIILLLIHRSVLLFFRRLYSEAVTAPGIVWAGRNPRCAAPSQLLAGQLRTNPLSWEVQQTSCPFSASAYAETARSISLSQEGDHPGLEKLSRSERQQKFHFETETHTCGRSFRQRNVLPAHKVRVSVSQCRR